MTEDAASRFTRVGARCGCRCWGARG